MTDTRPILVTGSTGYVGGRLVPRLLESGFRVRVVVRSRAKLEGRPWCRHPNLEIVEGDVLDRDSLRRATEGCGVVYYLVHSMNVTVKDFAAADRLAAQNMADAAADAGCERIIYLSGLGNVQHRLSKHLKSRTEVGEILGQGRTPVTTLRAAMIIGSGSASFEILRYLVDRLPIVIAPRWVDTQCQPIAIRNVLEYLMGCLKQPDTIGKVFDIGGPDIVTYRELMHVYAQVAGLHRRYIIGLPVLTSQLSAYWIHLVTPVPASIARPLAEGLLNTVVCQDHRIQELIPQQLLTCREAIQLALERTHEQDIESHWTDAGSIPPSLKHLGDPKWAGGTVYRDCRRITIDAPIQVVWEVLSGVGGSTGWFYGNWLWKLRGAVDRVIGGVGLQRGRRDATRLQVGDALDFWRVYQVDAPHRLTLLAEMKLPGTAMLKFSLKDVGPHTTELEQRALFLPLGIWGMLYWASVYPFHHIIFDGMLRGIASAATKRL